MKEVSALSHTHRLYCYAQRPTPHSPLASPKVPTVDTNLVQSLINIMECQLEEAFEAAAKGGGAGSRKQSVSKRKGSVRGEEAGPGGGGGGGGGTALDPKVRGLHVTAVSYKGFAVDTVLILSRFQEVRVNIGSHWHVHRITFLVGHVFYLDRHTKRRAFLCVYVTTTRRVPIGV